jgi:hypothetical protein
VDVLSPHPDGERGPIQVPGMRLIADIVCYAHLRIDAVFLSQHKPLLIDDQGEPGKSTVNSGYLFVGLQKMQWTGSGNLWSLS